jgi:hypothetical protein
MTWFEQLMGFSETSPDMVRAQLELHDDRLRSRVTGQDHGCGWLTIPSLAELRRASAPVDEGPLQLREVVANVQDLHLDPRNAGALFQAASQFNLLEMTSPNVTPERGVGIYEYDRTQGPACAIACGAGTIYRNYLVPVGEQIGQSAHHQVDCLFDLGEALGNTDGRLWKMQNGYALLQEEGLQTLNGRLGALDEEARDELRGRLRIGMQRGVEVTLGGAGHSVTQVYGSALPVAYGRGQPEQWEALARLVLEASYEATLRAAVGNARETGNPSVFLTLLGGGVFGNEEGWITDAIKHALGRIDGSKLDVAIVSYGRSQIGVRALVERWRASRS